MTRMELREMWAGRVSDFRASGQTAPLWCAEQEINLHTLRYWLKKLGNPKIDSMAPVNWLLFRITGDIVQRSVSCGGIIIVIGEARVEVEHGCNLTLLCEVIRTLTALC